MAADYIVTIRVNNTDILLTKILRLWSPQIYLLNCASLRLNCSVIIKSANELLEYKGDKTTNN